MAAAGDDPQAAVTAFLADPATHGGAAVERVDTPISRLFLAGDRAYKLRRAVRTNFLDFTGLAAREALAKIEMSIPPEHAQRLKTAPLFAVRSAAQPAPPKSLGRIRRAISDCRRLAIGYRSLLDKQSERIIRPLGLTNFGTVWLLTAWCELRDDFRDFRVDRIESLEVQPGRFEVEADKSFAAYLEGYADC